MPVRYRIYGSQPYLNLDDTNSDGIECYVNNDWHVPNSFSIEWGTGSYPFVIEHGSPTNLLYLHSDGLIGINTSDPVEDLEIQGESPGIRLCDSDPQSDCVDLELNMHTFKIRGPIVEIVQIDTEAPYYSFSIDSDGNVGLGTSNPSAPLELFSEDTFNFFRITAEGVPSSNKSVDFVFTRGPLGTGELRYNIVDFDGPEMRLNANGDMMLDGTLTTAGPSCAGGCDVVFDEDYKLRSIDEHAALMWEDRHLPAVGPTEPGAPVNLTEKMGDMLNELEHAHIYIQQLNQEIKALKNLNNMMAKDSKNRIK